MVLKSVSKLSASRIEELLSKWDISSATEQAVDSASQTKKDDVKPWERSKRLQAEDVSGELSITISNLLYINTDNLKPRIQNQIRRMAAFPNPVFFRNKAIGLSNYANSRFIYLGEDDSGYICIPRGLLEDVYKRQVLT